MLDLYHLHLSISHAVILCWTLISPVPCQPKKLHTALIAITLSTLNQWCISTQTLKYKYPSLKYEYKYQNHKCKYSAVKYKYKYLICTASTCQVCKCRPKQTLRTNYIEQCCSSFDQFVCSNCTAKLNSSMSSITLGNCFYTKHKRQSRIQCLVAINTLIALQKNKVWQKFIHHACPMWPHNDPVLTEHSPQRHWKLAHSMVLRLAGTPYPGRSDWDPRTARCPEWTQVQSPRRRTKFKIIAMLHIIVQVFVSGR